MIVNDLFMKHIVTGRGSTEFSRSVENINCEWARLMVWSFLNLNKPGADLWNRITWCLPKAWKGRERERMRKKSSFSFSSKIKTELLLLLLLFLLYGYSEHVQRQWAHLLIGRTSWRKFPWTRCVTQPPLLGEMFL